MYIDFIRISDKTIKADIQIPKIASVVDMVATMGIPMAEYIIRCHIQIVMKLSVWVVSALNSNTNGEGP